MVKLVEPRPTNCHANNRDTTVWPPNQHLHSSLFPGSAAVMRDRRAIFNRFDGQSGSLQSRYRTFSATAWSFDLHIDFFDTKFRCLLGALLSSTLSSKGRTLSASLESTGSSTCPTKRFAFGIRDGHRSVIESRLNMGYPVGYIPSYFPFLYICHNFAPRPTAFAAETPLNSTQTYA
jgi:hypothetical protein